MCVCSHQVETSSWSTCCSVTLWCTTCQKVSPKSSLRKLTGQSQVRNKFTTSQVTSWTYQRFNFITHWIKTDTTVTFPLSTISSSRPHGGLQVSQNVHFGLQRDDLGHDQDRRSGESGGIINLLLWIKQLVRHHVHFQEDPDCFLTEEEFKRRRPHRRFRTLKSLEDLVLQLGRGVSAILGRKVKCPVCEEQQWHFTAGHSSSVAPSSSWSSRLFAALKLKHWCPKNTFRLKNDWKLYWFFL